METLRDEHIMEILSWLPVKSLLQCRCVCKSWKSLICETSFVNLHLQKSPKNANLVLTLKHILDHDSDMYVMSCSKRSTMEDPSRSSTLAAQEGHMLLENKYWVIGSCNGLVCLRGHVRGDDSGRVPQYCVLFRNPATRLTSIESPLVPTDFGPINGFGSTKFGFGYDKSSDTYKLVVVINDRNAIEDSRRTQVKVYKMGGQQDGWRNIRSFPVIVLNHGTFVSDTLNWLGIRNYTSPFNWDTLSLNQLVIVSIDMEKETFKQFLLPGLDETPDFEPTIGVLGDCLCLFHDYKGTHFVVWEMKEYGVEESWTPFVKVSYEHLEVERPRWTWFKYSLVLPLCISEDGDVLMLKVEKNHETILYHLRNNTVGNFQLGIRIMDAQDYVPSLVRPL